MKRILLNAVMLLLALSPLVFAQPVYAAGSSSTCGKSAASQQVFKGINETGSASGSASNPCDASGIIKVVAVVINILSLVTGIAAIIAVISGGFKYITSGGDSGKIGNAKNTLIYALIGLAIAALAQALVHFVINTANDSANPTNKPKPKAKSSMIIPDERFT